MADVDSEYRIRAVIDPTAATAGAGQTVAEIDRIAQETALATEAAAKWGVSIDVARKALEQIKAEDFAGEVARVKNEMRESATEIDNVVDATGRAGDASQYAAEKSGRFAEELGGMRGGRRAAMELFEVLQGGGDTIAGITGLMRAFILTSSALDPIMLAFLGIGLALTGLIAKHEDAKKSGDDLKKSTDDLAKAQDDLAKKMAEDAIKRATDALQEQLRAQKELDEYIQTQSGYAVQAIKDLEARTEATKKLTLANLEQQKQEELNHATSNAQRDEIEARYKGREAAVSSNSEAEKYQLERSAFIQQAVAASDGLRSSREQADYNLKQYNDLKAKSDAAAAKADAAGVKPDQDGAYDQALGETKKENHDATAAYNKALHDGAPPARLDDLAQAVADSISKERAAFDADQTHKAFTDQGSKLHDSLHTLGDQIDKLTATYDHAISQRDTLEVDHGAAIASQNAAKIAEETARKKKLEEESNKAYGDKETPDYTNLFNTKLSPDDEAKFQAWAKSVGHEGDTFDYDLRGAWKNNAQQAANGHFPDTYKKPNHPTFSDQSVYSTYNNKGGHWGDDDDHPTFTPGPENLKNFSEDQLNDYFKRNDPDSKLILPDDAKADKKADQQQEKEERPLVEALQKSLTDQAKGDPELEAQLRAVIEAHKGETPTQQYLALFQEYNAAILTAKQKDQAALQIMGQMLIEFKSQITDLQRKTTSILNGANN